MSQDTLQGLNSHPHAQQTNTTIFCYCGCLVASGGRGRNVPLNTLLRKWTAEFIINVLQYECIFQQAFLRTSIC